jgi:hypothetical protein
MPIPDEPAPRPTLLGGLTALADGPTRMAPNTDQANNYDATGYNRNAVDEGDACDDTDNDGLLDIEEDPTGDGRQPTETDATKADTDGDGLCDGSKQLAPCIGYEEDPEGTWREPAWMVHGMDRDEAIAFGRPVSEAAIRQAAAKYNLSPDLVRSVIRAESNFQPTAVSSAGAWVNPAKIT